MALSGFGVWGAQLRAHDDPRTGALAAELEQLGYSALWFPAGAGNRGFQIAATLLRATSAVTVATGIVSIWATTPDQAQAGFAAMEAVDPGRFVLGVGVSHAALVDRGDPGRYARPLASMREYLSAVPDVPADRRIVAALGPKMLALAAAQSLGTHPYLVTPAMTRGLRAQLPQATIAAEQGIVLDQDPATARAKARQYLAMYLDLPNYTNNWLRHGYTEADLAGGGSDRLVDDLVVWGGIDALVAGVTAHWEAGADHVCVQVIGSDDPSAATELRMLAPALAEAAPVSYARIPPTAASLPSDE